MNSEYFVLYSSLLHVWHHWAMTQSHINLAHIKSKWNFYDAQLNLTLKGFVPHIIFWCITIIYISPYINKPTDLSPGFSAGTGLFSWVLDLHFFFFFFLANHQNHKCHVTNPSGAVGKLLHTLHYSNYPEVWHQRQQTGKKSVHFTLLKALQEKKNISKTFNIFNRIAFLLFFHVA